MARAGLLKSRKNTSVLRQGYQEETTKVKKNVLRIDWWMKTLKIDSYREMYDSVKSYEEEEEEED